LRARSVLVRVEPGTPVFADRDDRSRSSRSPAIALRCYASGEAARLSIERDGFESRTARHFRSVPQPGSALRSERRGRWFKSSHSDHFPRAMRRLSRALSARRQHWRAARSYKPGQRTAVDGRDRNPGRRPSNKQEVDMQAHPPAPFCAGRSVRNPRGLIRRDSPVQPRGPQPIMGSAIRTGWCRRRAVNAVPAGKRFDSVHFPPCGCSSMVEQSVANAQTSSSILPGRSTSPRKLIW
jgi:hypothetical protein